MMKVVETTRTSRKMKLRSTDDAAADSLTGAVADGGMDGAQLADTQYAFATQAKDVDTFSAGDRLGVIFTTPIDRLPEVASLAVSVIIEF